jgi:hypothetical protein
VLPFTPAAIRLATDADAVDLQRIAELDSQRPLAAPILLAQHRLAPIAAMSLADGRVVADPFQPTLGAVAALRVRAGALSAARRTPSLAERMRFAVRVARPAVAAS